MQRLLRLVGLCALAGVAFSIVSVRIAEVQGQSQDEDRVVRELSARFSGYVQRRQTAAPPAAGSAAPSSVENRLSAWAARTTANEQPRQGTIFTPEAAELIRRRLQRVLDGPQGAAARAELQEAADEHHAAPGVSGMEINRPVSAPELPYPLAAALPRPPHGLEYRFSGDRLLLRDESTSILVDYVANALPPTARRQAPPPPAAASAGSAKSTPPVVLLPTVSTSVKFAVLGDTGTGKDRTSILEGKYRAHAVAKMLEGIHAAFAFPLALMLGDNMYTDPDTKDKFAEEVVEPYKGLRAKGVVLRAVLGNHDNADFQLPLAELNFNNHRFYAFQVQNVRFLMLHSDEYVKHDVDPDQDAFIKSTLDTAFDGWTIAAFHHPLYSSGMHRDQNEQVRKAYRALLDGPVRVVFTGHEHFYERTKPKPGPAHFVSGAAAKLRNGDLHPSEDTDKGFDDEHSAMLVEIDKDEMYFRTIGLSGRTRDCGVLARVSGATLSQPAGEWLKRCQAKIGS